MRFELCRLVSHCVIILIFYSLFIIQKLEKLLSNIRIKQKTKKTYQNIILLVWYKRNAYIFFFLLTGSNAFDRYHGWSIDSSVNDIISSLS